MEVVDEAGAVVALAAPTGKAAKRLEETCGQAMTVHRPIRPPEGYSLQAELAVAERDWKEWAIARSRADEVLDPVEETEHGRG
ncbi:hypothetical protein [Streptomyces sp. NPDC094468]|uniref:hypothetical protein n=1 Tax=Streptomyces sp. NPDC094468 TaxID=3366066 RepID=UPI003811607E